MIAQSQIAALHAAGFAIAPVWGARDTEAAMTSEVDTREVERTATDMAMEAREHGDHAFAGWLDRAAQAIAQERAARERAEALLQEADKRLCWEGLGMRRDFQDEIEVLFDERGSNDEEGGST
jgi:predicted trehalose synthase